MIRALLAFLMGLVVCFGSDEVWAAATPQPHVIDQARSLFETTRANLETESRQIEADTGVEVFVMIQPSLDGRSAREAAQAAPIWRPERQQVLLYLAMAERQVRIEASPSLSGRISDAAWTRLIETEMLPALRNGRNGAAVRAGHRAIGRELAGAPPSTMESLKPRGDLRALRDIIFVLIAGVLAAISFNGARHLRLVRGRW